LPGSKLRLPALTQKDLADVPFVVKPGEVVGLSLCVMRNKTFAFK
jgi:hypothetical protein